MPLVAGLLMNQLNELKPNPMRVITILTVFSLCFMHIYAQTNTSDGIVVTGYAVGSDNNPIEVINVVQFSCPDTVFIKGDWVLTDDKGFSFNAVYRDSSYLEFSALGYENKRIKIAPDGQPAINLNQLVFNTVSESLSTVTVVSRRKRIVHKDGITVLNVDGTSLQNNPNLTDILNKSPGLTVSKDQIIMFGKGAVDIYMDDQKVSFELLNTINVDDVQNIEIIQDPGSKYDSESNAVVNIILKKDRANTRRISIAEYVTYPNWMNNTSLTLSGSTQKYGGHFNFFQERNQERIDLQESNSGVETIYNRNYLEQQQFSEWGANTSFYYKPSAVDKISLNAIYKFRDKPGSIESGNARNYSGQSTEIISTHSMNNLTHIASAGIRYDRDIDTLGGHLRASATYQRYFEDNKDMFEESVNAEQIQGENNSLNSVDISTLRLDYSKRFSGISLESGIKNNWVSANNQISFFDRVNDEPISNSIYSGNHNYLENIAAAYAQIAFTKKKNNFKIGYRGELINYKGTSNGGASRFDTLYYANFPYFKYSYKHENYELGLSFNPRISRPTFQDLTPYLLYIDRHSAYIGNPSLLPKRNYVTQFFFNRKNFSSYFTYIKSINSFQEINVLDNNNNIRIQTVNVDLEDIFVGRVAYSLEKKHYYLSLASNLIYRQMQDENYTVERATPFAYIDIYAEAFLKKDFNLNLSGIFYNGFTDGIFRVNTNYFINFGLNKSFMEKRLTVSFNINDILNSDRYSGGYIYQGAVIDTAIKELTQTFTLGLKYKIGSQKNNYDKIEITPDSGQIERLDK